MYKYYEKINKLTYYILSFPLWAIREIGTFGKQRKVDSCARNLCVVEYKGSQFIGRFMYRNQFNAGCASISSYTLRVGLHMR